MTGRFLLVGWLNANREDPRLNSTAPATAFPEISHEFGIPEDGFETAFFMVTAWTIAAGLFPMVTLSLMDSYGTYWIVLISHVLFILFVLPQALAQNFATLIVVRVFAGACGGTLQNGTEAVLSNLFRVREERVVPVTLFILSLVAGVTLGPVQGAVVHVLGWRWVFWLQLIIYGSLLPLTIFGLQETRGSVIEARFQHQSKSHQESDAEIAKPGNEIIETLSRSAKLLSTEFIVFSFMLWSAFSYGLIFISTESITVVFGESFNFEPYHSGLVQVSMLIGEALGALACMCFQWLYIKPSTLHDISNPDPEKSTKQPKQTTLEQELYLSVPATIIGLSGGLFIYGWTAAFPSTPWIAPAIGLALQGFAIQVILTGTTIYLTDCYGMYAASAIAGVAIGENIFAAFLPLASLPMYQKLGFQWASTLLACVGLVLVVPPVALVVKGSGIRMRSPAMRELAGR